MTISLDKDIPRLLGVAYLIQFIGSLLSGPIFDTATGSGDVSQKLVSISNNVMLIRISIINYPSASIPNGPSLFPIFQTYMLK